MKATMFVRVLPLTVLLLLPASAFAQTDPNVTPAQLVDALNAVFGKQTDNRAVHAKGVVLEGKFAPSPEASEGATSAKHVGPGHDQVFRLCRRFCDPRYRS